MCRFLLYSGPEVLVSSVVIDPDHGMIQQAERAHDSITPLNADGFGVAWYVPSISPIPACFRDVSPAWSNQNLKQITRVSKSHLIFAHVRAASLGNVMQTNCHPFTFKNLTFMHNGTVPHYKFIKRKMQNSLSDRAYGLIHGTTDSEMMFAMFVTHFERLVGEQGKEDEAYEARDYTQDMGIALRAMLQEVHQLALEYENSLSNPGVAVESDGADSLPYTQAIGRLNVAATDGNSTVAARYVCSDPKTAHSLYYTRGTSIEYKGKNCCVSKCPSPKPNSQQMVIVSSEPLGSQYDCEVVPANHMVLTGPNNYFSLESCKYAPKLVVNKLRTSFLQQNRFPLETQAFQHNIIEHKPVEAHLNNKTLQHNNLLVAARLRSAYKPAYKARFLPFLQGTSRVVLRMGRRL